MLFSQEQWVIFSLSFVVWLTLSTQTGLLGCCHFKSCTDPIHTHFFLNCLVHIRHNLLCLHEYSPWRTFWNNFVCIWPHKLRKITEFEIICCPRGSFLCVWVLCLLHLITLSMSHVCNSHVSSLRRPKTWSFCNLLECSCRYRKPLWYAYQYFDNYDISCSPKCNDC